MISLNAAFSACEKGGQWEQALTLLHKMCDPGMTANVIGFKVAMSPQELVGTKDESMRGVCCLRLVI